MDKLKLLRMKIENLEKFHQIHIFSIIKEHKIPFTENRNGIFINLIKVPKKTIDAINTYLLYVYEQDTELKSTEKIKEDLEAKFFKDKDNKDKLPNMVI